MDEAAQTQSGTPIGWIVAVLLVIGVWAGAYAWRGGGEKQVLSGWADGLAAGQVQAERADKPMVVLFTAGWCPPCRTLKKNVLSQDAVHAALLSDFVPVQVDLTDQSSNNPNVAVAQRYGVQSIPAVIVMTPGGQSIEAYRGDHTTDAFMAWLKRLSQ